MFAHSLTSTNGSTEQLARPGNSISAFVYLEVVNSASGTSNIASLVQKLIHQYPRPSNKISEIVMREVSLEERGRVCMLDEVYIEYQSSCDIHHVSFPEEALNTPL
jgi:hypothetical protein